MGSRAQVVAARLPGWEARLAAVIDVERHRAFVWGAADCWQLARTVTKALTGADVGDYRYASQREALKVIAQRAQSFPEFVSMHWPEISPKLVRRGDLMLVPQPGMPALGVCLGESVAVRLEGELGFLPRSVCTAAWGVG